MSRFNWYALVFIAAFSPVCAQQTTESTVTFTYDAAGNVKSINRPLSRTTSYVYDSLRRPVQQSVSLGANTLVTKQAFDGQHHLSSVTDPRNLTTSYKVDGLGDTSQVSSPDTSVTGYTFDEAGNVKTVTDARGKTSSFQYDALGRVTLIQYDSGVPSQFEYDGGPGGPVTEIGNLTRISDESGTTAFTHDLEGRVLTRTQVVTAAGANVQLTLQYTYGHAGPETGKLTSITYPSGARVNYLYGDHGRVSSVTLNQSAISPEVTLLSEITYTASGVVQSWRWGSGTLPAYQRTYDLDGRLTSYPIDMQGTIRTVGYDAAGMIASYSHTGGSNPAQFDQTFSYDAADRLIGFTSGGITTGYSYDANGNRIQQTGPNATYSYDPKSNRLNSATFATSKVYGYDASGNRISDGQHLYTYNSRGRLSGVRGGTVLNIYYNALGERVLKASGISNSYYIYDQARRTVGEYNQGNGSTAETVYLDELPIVVIKPQGYSYVLADQIFTPLILAQQDGTISWDWRNRDPFGNNEPTTSSELSVYNQRFPGQIADIETGIFYNYFRDYDPLIGRYIQSDPIGLNGGINTYGYVYNGPLSNIDSLGLFPRTRICLNGLCPPVPPPSTIEPITGRPWASVVEDDGGRGRGRESSANSRSRDTCNTDQRDPCEEIRKKIRDIEQKLASKEKQMTKNTYDLYNRAYSSNPGGDLEGKGTYIGHIAQIDGLRIGLERARAQARAMGCL